MDTTPIISARGLSVRYGRRLALEDVSFDVPGGAMGLLGPNGAGKSTLIRVILGFLRPERGEITVLGRKVSDAALRLYERLADRYNGQTFTGHDVEQWDESLPRRAITDHLGELYRAGYLEMAEASRGPKPTQWRLSGRTPGDGGIAMLPDVAEIFPDPACANALHIAHIPDWAKEKAILELLANDENKLDAVVQCGTNMSLIDVSEKLEPVVGIPILGINAVTFWYALRENGFEGALVGAGRLLREF